jgi:predicted ATPase
VDKAIELSVKAARYAVEKAAYELAINYFRNALSMLGQICKTEVP